MKKQTNKAFLRTVYQWVAECGEVLIFGNIHGISPNLLFNKQQIQHWLSELNDHWQATRLCLTVQNPFAIKEFAFSLRRKMNQAFVETATASFSIDLGSS